MGSIQFQGDDGSGYHVGAQIHAIVQSGVGNDDMPTDLVFATNNGSTSATERLRITSEGHTIPGVDSTSDLGLTGTRWRNLYADTLYGDGSTLTGVASTTILEDAGINTAGTSTFTNILATGIATAANFDSTSDIRLKTNIEVIQDPLAKVIQIEGVSFNWKQDNRPALGVIADQVQQILPQLVHGDDPKTVNYNGLIGLLIEAVKEQQTQIDELKSKLS